jgi:hypothetical protein
MSDRIELSVRSKRLVLPLLARRRNQWFQRAVDPHTPKDERAKLEDDIAHLDGLARLIGESESDV